MSNLSGCKIYDTKLDWMKDIFKAWVEFNERYQKLHVFDGEDDEDSLFWTREQAAVGILAGAAWSVGGYAVQEVAASKKTNADRRKWGGGREDLYIGRSEDWAKAIRLEAKLREVNANERLKGHDDWTIEDEIHDTLEEARYDAKRYERYGNLGVLAIAHFHAPKHPDGDYPKCKIEDVAKAVKKIKDVDAAAWYFDAERRVKGKSHYYFGTALFISIVGSYDDSYDG